MKTNKTAQISSIIDQRRPLAHKIKTVEENLRSLVSKLGDLEKYKDELLAIVDKQNIRGRLHEIDCSTIQRNIETELLALTKLRVRFERNTLNIGVIGRARQGKSRLLQSLTGLTTAEIPDGDLQDCTGVRSTIHHNPNVETYGEVWFYSEQSLLNDVIVPYYEKLQLGSRPTTLESFKSNPLALLPDSLRGYASAEAMYGHLKRYHINIEQYFSLLKNSSPRRISRAEIREYVAQDNSEGERIYFNYLAVQDVKITCQFPQEEVGKIALIDMPGLGDTGIGDEERLVKTLGQDVDLVLLVRMPKPAGDSWTREDTNLYDIAKDSLIELPFSEWSFLVLNHLKAHPKYGDNFAACKSFAETINQKGINVVNQVIADCSNPEEAGAVLDLILNYMGDQIVSLDRRYASSCQERLIRIHGAVAAELGKAGQVLEKTSDSDHWFPLFVKLFNSLWTELTNDLEELLKELREKREQQDIDFKQRVDAALEACRQNTGIPSTAEIETLSRSPGGYPNAYYQLLNEIRSNLSQHFLLLDEGLKQGIDKVKLQVTQVLIESGSLGHLTKAEGTEFLEQITELIPESLTQLKLGFKILANFNLHYRGMIQHRIRQHLDNLTPNETLFQLSTFPSPQEVSDLLKNAHAEAVYYCEGALDDLLAEPSQAAFAIVEEFLDQVLRAKNAKDQWRIFLEEFRSQIWSKEFEQLGEKTRTRKQWLELVESAVSANQISGLKFLD